MTARTDTGETRRKSLWLVLAAAAVLALLAALLGAPRYLSPRALVANYADLQDFAASHWWQAVAVYALVYTALVALSVPGALVMTIAGGLFFGWLIGGAIAVLAATLGATLLFLLARTTLGEALAARAGPRLDALREGFHDDAASYLLFLRLVPLFPFWLVNLAPALLGVSLGVFVITTLAGIAPGTFAFSVIGAGLDSVVREQAESLRACEASSSAPCDVSLELSAFVTPGLLAALAALGVLALLPAVVKKVWRGKTHGDARRADG